MATIKVKFRKSTVAGKPGSIYYQLCHEGKVKQLSTNIHLCPEYWDTKAENIIKLSSEPSVNPLLSEYHFKIDSDLSRLKHIIGELDVKGDKYTLSDVISLFNKSESDLLVFSFFEEQIEHCKLNRQMGTVRNYQRTLNSIRTFLKGNDIPFTMITETLVLEYERWLAGNGVVRNSSSFYIRNLRSIYNKAVKRNLTEQRFPFNNAYTGTDRTRKRAVGEDVIMRLLKMNLDYSKPLALARDLFVFSYCTPGMSFVDISFLKKSDVSNSVISYVRHKTGQQLCIRIEPCIEKIIKQYETETADSIYVFPIITATDPEVAYNQYQIALSYHNRKLKRLGEEIGEHLYLSSYTARHTWATTARNHNVPISVISEGMGHTSERTTQIYLASLENSVIDEANKEILERLNRVVSL